LKRSWGPVNFWGLDPLYVANEGKLVAFVNPHDVNKVLEKMEGNEYNTEAQIIGQVVADYQGKVFMKTG
jgi:hydrogenase expression/formation protein HypE